MKPDPITRSVAEFAAIIGACPRKARSLIDAEEIPAAMIGGSIRILLSDIEAFIRDRRIQKTEGPSDLKNLVHAAVLRAKAKSRKAG